ncbi:hypothetical protein K470DRAFT_247113 [Piedraia hortae CBS 480.64]|uniref:DUF7924 domain-containing protein n=1 Tax=Piedraia hortae CBS 480.64 TaxID=1314780 RepID=A0A6A7BZH5_9PEZI|nr:hypothetical protein K470DRAFT_247113 [Piedraia hortae CBS 480.64]
MSEDKIQYVDAYYGDPAYASTLAMRGSYLTEHMLDIDQPIARLCQNLNSTPVDLPSVSLFDNRFYKITLHKLVDANEMRVMRDITQLLVPSAESLATCALEQEYEFLKKSTNQGWNRCRKLTNIRPQPDYAVGFKKTAFTSQQVQRIWPFLGAGCISPFKARDGMLFPFLACEVKGNGGFICAARCQNAHSMGIAVFGVVNLFRLLGEEETLHRKILAFSIAHDASYVSITGHYPVLSNGSWTVHSHMIFGRKLGAREEMTQIGTIGRWSSLTVVKNVYRYWAPDHLKMLRDALNRVPDIPDVFLKEEFQGYLNKSAELLYNDV